jgi:uncharacterized membrane protein
MESWHPALVHFPIALLPLSVGLDLAALLKNRPQWHGMAYGVLILGTVGALMAVVSGNQAALAYRDLAISNRIEDHEDLSTAAFLLLLVIGLGRLPLHLQNRLCGWPIKLWILLAAVASGMLWVSAYWGGRLVYIYGVGVKEGLQVPGGF